MNSLKTLVNYNNTDSYRKEINLINYEILSIIIFIITLIVSITLNFNEKLIKLNKPHFFNHKDTINISLINRLIVVFIAIYFVYSSFENKKINNNNYNSNLEILISLFSLAASLISFYLILINYNNKNFNVSGIEQPTL